LEAEEILNHLKLMDIQDRNWNIQGCSALTKEGRYLYKNVKKILIL
jgi:hypothetical protein